MNTKKSNNNLIPAIFTRLPIFDIKKNLWGYELIYYSADGGRLLHPSTGDEITANLISGTALVLEQTMDKENKIMVSFSRKNLLEFLPYTLPPGRSAVKITDPDKLSESHLQALGRLKQDGYQITVNWIEDHKAFQTLFNPSDIIYMDISNRVLPELIDICKQANSYNSMMLAHRVNNQTEFEICSRAGFSFFQGSFFKKSGEISSKKISFGTISKFQLIKVIEAKSPDFLTIAATIQADAAISTRLLSYLNSAPFGFKKKLYSIKDAITTLGWHNLKPWIRVALLAEVSENQHASELIFLSAQRGKFLEQVGLSHDFWGFEPDTLFLLGTFSFLDTLLNQPMTKVIKHLPLTDKLKGALCMSDNNEYVPLLKLARYFEEAAFEQSNTMINQLGLDTIKTNQAYCSAINWANPLNQMQLKN
ncbi:MAG: HDOD domain-containing protein [Desulfobacteraceae bacterium]|nr:HDOD domain-containing protein [Desulfobacteraceae bacterium]